MRISDWSSDVCSSDLENEGFNEEACEDAARFLAGAIRIRAIGEPIIALETLKGVGNRRLMRLAVINDDMPFLVDSVAATLSAEGIAVHRLIHPVVSVVRDEKGVLTSISPSGRDSTQHASIIYFETDRADARRRRRSEEPTYELQSLMRLSY